MNARLSLLFFLSSLSLVTLAVETDPPELVSISVDKYAADISTSEQTFTFQVEATDESGIDWSKSAISFKPEGGALSTFVSSDPDNSGQFMLTLSNEDQSGIWQIQFLRLIDVHGNRDDYYGAELVALDLKVSWIYPFDGFTLDVDYDGSAKALSDGLLVIRHLFGFSGDSLTAGALAFEGLRTSPDLISVYLQASEGDLDIDGDGEAKPLTDGLLLIRYLFGFSGDSLTAGAIGEGAERTTAEEIEAYIGDRVPQT